MLGIGEAFKNSFLHLWLGCTIRKKVVSTNIIFFMLTLLNANYKKVINQKLKGSLKNVKT